MGHYEDLISEACKVLSVANDLLRQQGRSEDELLTVTSKLLYAVMEHDWDGDPGDPGRSYVLGVTADITVARTMLHKGTEEWHDKLEPVIDPYDELGQEEIDELRHHATTNPEEFTWISGEVDVGEGTKRWIAKVTLST